MLEKVVLSVAGASVVAAVGIVVAGQVIRKDVKKKMEDMELHRVSSGRAYFDTVEGLRRHEERIHAMDTEDNKRIRDVLEDMAQEDPYYNKFLSAWQ